jgi:hypothetical protein
MRLICPLFLVVSTISTVVHAFVVPIHTARLLTTTPMPFAINPALRTHVALAAEPEGEASAIECFIVNNELVQTEGDAPEVVCTSEPDEYAWFNGIDPEALKPTEGTEEGGTECVEGASPRGIPEWECK